MKVIIISLTILVKKGSCKNKQESDKLIAEMHGRLSSQDIELKELFGRLSRSERDQAFEQKLHRDLTSMQGNYDHAMTKVRSLQEDIVAVHSAMITLCDKLGIRVSKKSLGGPPLRKDLLEILEALEFRPKESNLVQD